MRVARDVVRFKRDGGLAISAGVMTFDEMLNSLRRRAACSN
jgi:hypothetical protein